MLDLTDIPSMRTEKSQTWLTGKVSRDGIEERRTTFHAAHVFLPDLKTVVDLNHSRLSGQDIVFDRLAGGAKLTFDGACGGYTLEKRGAALRYECVEGCDLVSVVGQVVTYRRRSDGLEIKFNVSRTFVWHFSDLDPAKTPEPGFKKIADQRGMDTFGFLRPKVYDPDSMRVLMSGDITHAQDGKILTGFDLSKFRGRMVRPDPSSTFETAAGDGHAGRIETDATWAACRDGTTATDANATSAYPTGSKSARGDYNPGSTMYSVTRDWLGPFQSGATLQGVNITAATLKVASLGANGDPEATTLHVVGSTRASQADVVAADFDNVGSTSFGTKTIASMAAGLNSITLNANGRASISTLGVNADFVTRNSLDLNNVAPTNHSNSHVGVYTEAAEASSQLDVTYEAPVSTRKSAGPGMMGIG